MYKIELNVWIDASPFNNKKIDLTRILSNNLSFMCINRPIVRMRTRNKQSINAKQTIYNQTKAIIKKNLVYSFQLQA